MSLGFLTESALLPSKAKPIKVDGKSLVDLKALVFEREQRLKESAGDSDGDGEESGGLRRQRGPRAPEAGARRREDLFSRPNRGVAERNVRDEEAREGKKRRAAGMMQAKAELYEKMASGAVIAGADTLLVDFSRKPPDEVELLSRAAEGLATAAAGGAASNEAGDGGGGSKDDDIEIQDEFGRSRIVKRGSTEARAHRKRLREEAKRRQEDAAVARDAAEEERRAAAAVRHRAAVAAGAPGGGGAWAWSSGAATSGDGETAGGGSSSWRGSAASASVGGRSGRNSKESGVGEVLEAMAEARGGSKRSGRDGDGGNDVDQAQAVVSRGARVLSAWEKGLKNEEKAFLEGIRQETLEGRSKGGGADERKRQLEERRELLRAKRKK